MISLDDYVKNPCAGLSIPYWKAKTLKLPDTMKIVHDSVFSEQYLHEYADDPFFRLFRKLDSIDKVDLDGFVISTAAETDFKTIVSVINRSYTDLQVDLSQIEGYTKTPVYDKNLWVLAIETHTGHCVGCGIADYDRETRELILEWVQVLPSYRNRKIGQAIVHALLSRGRPYAAFATVSGRIDNPSKPEILYRKCGFTGNDVWHILRKK